MKILRVAGFRSTRSSRRNCLEYRINVAAQHQSEGDGLEPLYDGTAELWWESVEAVEASFASDIGKRAGADADEFCELSLHLYTEEHFVVRRNSSK